LSVSLSEFRNSFNIPPDFGIRLPRRSLAKAGASPRITHLHVGL
jgi:hypothetical protein